MSATEHQNNPSPAAIREEVRRTIQQLNEMAGTEKDFDLFCDSVLAKVVKITGAHGALFWQINGSNQPLLTHQTGAHPNEAARQVLSHENQQHADAVLEVINTELPMGLTSEAFTGSPGDSDSTDDSVDSEGASDESFLMLFSPVYNRTKKCCGTLELLQRGDITPKAQEGYLRFLTQISSLFQTWHEQQPEVPPNIQPSDQQTRDQRTSDQQPGVQQPSSPSETGVQTVARQTVSGDSWTERIEFISEVHGSIDRSETCFAIANEARRLLGCDRVSVGTWNGRTCKIVAISSQDRFDNRANVVRLLSSVATASVSADSPLWITGSTEGIAPEVARKINDYLDESHSRTLAVIPLFARAPETPDLEMKSRRREKSKKLGVIIFEFFDADVLESSIEEDRKLIVNQSQLALENARQHAEIFMLPVWQRLGWLQQLLFRDHRAKTITGLSCLAIVMLLLLFFPKELKMKVEGVMHPTVRKTIFAQTDGVVREVLIDERETVKQGQLMLKMVNPDLELQMSATAFELKNVEANINNTQAQLSSAYGDPTENQDFAGTIRQLQQQKKSLELQLELMQRKQSYLDVVSPIAGTVITPQPQRRYKDFPATANLAMLEVVQLDGPWQLELKIPENKIAYIDQQMGKNPDEPLEVDFKIGTNPNLNLKGTLTSVSRRAVPSETGPPDYRAIVEIERSQLTDLQETELRSGAGATAKIRCGKRSLGFVCFYQIYDFMRTKVFF